MLTNELELYIRARFTLIVLTTVAEERALELMRQLCERMRHPCISWDVADGFQAVAHVQGTLTSARDSLTALEQIDSVPRGTPYPTREPISRVVVKATYTGQTQMGIDIFEMGDSRASMAWELVFDPSGAARVVALSEDQQRERTQFCMNEHAPTFLTVDPPAQRGEPCFEVLFAIEANKRLLITVRDLRTLRLVRRTTLWSG